MILDANVLLYAVDESATHHERARTFLQDHLNGDARVGIPWQSLSAFVRIATHPRVMRSPLAAGDAVELVDAWLAAPAAWLPEVTTATWSVARQLLVRHGARGNLVPDALLAALALQHGVAVVSADTDFARFEEVSWDNPFSAA